MKDLSLLGSMIRGDNPPAGKSLPREDPAVLASQLAASSAMSRRRIRMLSVFLAVAAVASALGYVRWQVPALLVPWIAGVWISARAIAASPPQRTEWVETLSFCL